MKEVYPRACGGTVAIPPGAELKSGLSPRVRGNPSPMLAFECLLGSIPARAGEPAGEWPGTYKSTVYPRACGGTIIAAPDLLAALGLSPRVRGNHVSIRVFSVYRGSIPARAGEPDRGFLRE